MADRGGHRQLQPAASAAGWLTFAKALFASELAVTSSSGAIKTREGELADIRPSDGLQMHFFRTKGVDVRMYSGTAVVIGLAEWEFAMGGQTRSFRRRYTAVYARGGSLGWRMVALHIGPAPAVQPTP